MRLFIFLLALLPCTILALDNSAKKQLLNNLKREVSELYIIEDKIPKVLASLDFYHSPEQLDKLSSEKTLSEAINKDLKQFDKHFSLRWSDPQKITSTRPTESYWEKLARKNSGFNKVEILEGNVGYIDFWGFDLVNEQSTQKVVNAMSFVADTNALIFDLRNNGGGSPEMVQLISSYLFNKRTLLNRLYFRYSNQTHEFWTSSDVKGKKLTNIPIYILTSQDTFSAAEEFAYNLQSLKRATLVGETTAGGAHPVRFVDLGGGFTASIPFGKAINPITQTNWEWVGVSPDFNASKENAFDLAYKKALETVLESKTSLSIRKEIEAELLKFSNEKDL